MATALTASPPGQNHDPLNHKDGLSIQNMLPNEDVFAPSGEPADITPFQKMLSATTGSLITGLTMTPLDVVRVRWQSQNVRNSQEQSSSRPAALHKMPLKAPDAFRPANLGVTSCCREVFFMGNNAEICVVGPHTKGPAISLECAVEETQKKTFHSTFDGMRKIARNEGFFTLWRGLSPTLLMAVPANMIYFTGYEWLRYDKMSPFAKMDNTCAPLAAGAIARVVAATSIGPIELFRTKLQASHGETATSHVKDTFTSMQDAVKTNGYRSLWRGLSLTLWRDVPFSGMYWWGYETMRGKLTEAREHSRGRTYDGDISSRRRSQSLDNHRETFIDSCISGFCSGALACVATMPFDVGKTRTQVYHDTGKSVASHVGKAATVPEEQSMFQLLGHIVQTEGPRGLFRGWLPRVMKVAPACAIMISSFEMGKKVFRDVNKRGLDKEGELDVD